MASLVAASALFLLIHFGVSGTRLRDMLSARLGEGPYRGVFALASLLSLVWMIMAFRRAPFIHLWGPTPELLPVAEGLVLIAFVFVVVGLSTRNPTSIGREAAVRREDVVSGILRITRHPFLWGTALWALVHVVMNGELRALVLFGSLLVLALRGPAAIDAKRRRKLGSDWERFERATSNVPFAAIIARRNRLGPALREIGLWRLLLALAVFGAVLMLHGKLFGHPLT